MSLLVRLQRLDSELFDVLSAQRGLPEEINDLKGQATAYASILNARKKKHDESEVQKRLLTSEIQTSQEKIKKYKDAQTSARNNKEYDALSKQIEYEEIEIKKAESKIKAIDEDYQRQRDLEAKGEALLDENNDEDVTDEMMPTEYLQKRLKALESEVAEKSNELTDIINETQSDIDALNEKIKAQRTLILQLDKHVLSKYDALRSAGIQNVVVQSKSNKKTDKKDKTSTVTDMFCGGCNFKVPASQHTLIRRGGLYICESCGRIIVSEELFKEDFND
ncbi:MAG: C4-type zinc ribbon domain-containing protein [Chloroherpetonaceae bacterium]